MRIVLALSCLFIFLGVHAKEYEHHVQGYVLDYYSGENLGNITVRLLTADSVVLATDRTTNRGMKGCYNFSVKKVGKYIVEASAVGYEKAYVDFRLRSQREEFIYPENIRLKKKTHEIDEVVVTGTKLKMIYSGDTIIYNADAFKLPEGSMLDALVRQLPGARIDGKGRIYINGEFVESLLLNGRNFFSGNPKLALKNLPSYIMSRIKVYRKDKVVGAGSKQLVMDVWLKKEYAKGYIGRNETGVGTQLRYKQKNMIVRFSDVSRLMGYINLNNLNDNQTVGYESEWEQGKPITGKQTTFVGGMMGQRFWDDESYFFTENKLTGISSLKEVHTNRQTLTESGDVISDNHDSQEDKNMSVELAATVQLANMKKLKLKGVSLTVGMDYERKKQTTDDSLLTQQNGLLVNSRTVRGLGRQVKKSFFSELTLSKKIVANDYVVANVEFKYGHNRLHDFNQEHYPKPLAGSGDSRNTYHDGSGRNTSVKARATYYYRWPRHEIAPYYIYEHRHNESDSYWYRLDRLKEADSLDIGMLPSDEELERVLDSHNSYTRKEVADNHTVGLSMTRSFETNNNIQIQLPVRLACRQLDEQRVTNVCVERKAAFFEPNVSCKYSFNDKREDWHELKMKAQLESKMPSMSSLVGYSDDSDPLFVRVGNRNLKNIQSLDVKADYKTRQKKGHMVNVDLHYRTTRNAVINSYSLDPITGVTTYSTENVNGNWLAEGKVGTTLVLGKSQRLTVDNQLHYLYQQHVDKMLIGSDNSSYSHLCESTLSDVLKMNCKLHKNVHIGANAKVKWSHVADRDKMMSTINACDYSFGLSAIIDLPWQMQLNTDINDYFHRGYQYEQMNTSELIWNARLTKKIKKWLIAIEGYDILGKAQTRTFFVDSQGRTETTSNTITRYAMFSVSYNFHINPRRAHP
jgi:hypothetical protein